MLTLNKRSIVIMRYLLNSNVPISSEVLASILGTTSKTIRADIKMINEILGRVGANIVSKSGSGYALNVYNNVEFSIFLDNFNEKYYSKASLPNYNVDRIRYIINQLLLSEGYIKGDRLLEELYISRSLLTSEFKHVRNILNRYHLNVIQKPNFGLKVSGEEIQFRIALLDYGFIDEDNSLVPKEKMLLMLDINKCATVVVKYLRGSEIHIPYKSVRDIAQLISINAFRNNKEKRLKFKKIEKEELYELDEYSIAKKIYDELDYNFDDDETCFLALYLASRRIYTPDDKFDLSRNKTLYFLSDELLRIIYIYTDVNFLSDNNIRGALARELRGLLLRLTYKIEHKNLPLNEVKKIMPTFVYAQLMVDYLKKRYGYDVPDNEIAELALILQQSLSKYNLNYEKQKICLVFNRGYYSSYGVQNVLWQNFGEYIDYIENCEFYELTPRLVSKYDLLVTDMPRINFEYDIPILQILGAFGKNEIKKAGQEILHRKEEYEFISKLISQDNVFIGIDAKSKKEALKYLCEKLENNLGIDKIFENVMVQESLTSSERENNVAIAHTLYPIFQKSGVAIGILKKPILWDQEMVQLVFVVVDGGDEKYTFMTLSLIQRIANDIFSVHDILNSKSLTVIQNVIYKKIVLDV